MQSYECPWEVEHRVQGTQLLAHSRYVLTEYPRECSVLRLALDYSTFTKGSNIIKGNVWKTL